MFVVSLTKEDKIQYKVLKRLRQLAPLANIETLKQISIYMARSGFDGDVYKDIIFKYNENTDTSVLCFNNGMQIEFNDYLGNFNFMIRKKENHFSMQTLVYLKDQNDLSSVNIYSELKIKGFGMYVVSFRPKDLCNENSLKFGTINYYTNDEIDWVKEIARNNIENDFDLVAIQNGIYPFSEKSDFEMSLQRDLVEDCYQGYVSNVLMRIDLLYDNMKYLRIKRKKKEKNR